MAKFLLLENKPYEEYQKIINVDIIESFEIFRIDKEQIHFKFKDGTSYIKRFDSKKEMDNMIFALEKLNWIDEPRGLDI